MSNNTSWPTFRSLIGYALGLTEYRCRCLIEAHTKFERIDGGDLDDGDLAQIESLLNEWTARTGLPRPKRNQTPLEWTADVARMTSDHRMLDQIIKQIEQRLTEVGFKDRFAIGE